jgi:hypothetical protein
MLRKNAVLLVNGFVREVMQKLVATSWKEVVA